MNYINLKITMKHVYKHLLGRTNNIVSEEHIEHPHKYILNRSKNWFMEENKPNIHFFLDSF